MLVFIRKNDLKDTYSSVDNVLRILISVADLTGV